MNASETICAGPQETALGRTASYLALGFVFASWLGGCGDSGQSNSRKDTAVDLPQDTGGPSAADAKEGGDTRPPNSLDASDALLVAPEKPADARIFDSGQDGPSTVADTGGLNAAEVGSVDNAGQGNPIDATASEAGWEAPASFACSTLGPVASDVSQRLCLDFSNPNDIGSFTPEAGTWSVVDGTYKAIGPQDGQVTCPGGMFSGSGMTTSVLTTLSAADVRVHAHMTSWTQPDKVLALRSRPSGNRIEINFRSYYASGGTRLAGDVAISALFDCNNITFVDAGIINVPQYPYQPIAVDVQLRGQRLTIVVDGKQIYDDTPTTTDSDGGTWQLPTAPGSVGFGVFTDGQDVFDDLVVEVLK